MAKKTDIYMNTYTVTIPWIASSNAIARRDAWNHLKKILRDGSQMTKWELDEIPARAPGGLTRQVSDLSDMIRPWTSRSKICGHGLVGQELKMRKDQIKTLSLLPRLAPTKAKPKGGPRKKKR